MDNKFAATLGLCMRAKKLTFGFDTVKQSVLFDEVFLLMAASDLSPKTEKEVRYLAEQNGVPFLALPETMEDVAKMIGKKTGVIGITEEGFAKKLLSYRELDSNFKESQV